MLYCKLPFALIQQGNISEKNQLIVSAGFGRLRI